MGGNQLVHVGKVLIVETSMAVGMPKSNEGGSAVFYGIGRLSNQQPRCSPHLRAPLLVRPTGPGAVAGLSRLQQHRLSPVSFLATSMLILCASFPIWPVAVGRCLAPLGIALTHDTDIGSPSYACMLLLRRSAYLGAGPGNDISLDHPSSILRARCKTSVMSLVWRAETTRIDP